MKRGFLLTGISVLMSIMAFGQGYNNYDSQSNFERYQIAFYLNPQVSWFKSDNSLVESGGGLFGYNFGVAVDRFFSPNYAFATGLSINSTGGILKYPTATSGITDKYTYRLKYIEVPFGLKLKTNEFKRMTFYGQFGGGLSVNIKTNIKINGADGEAMPKEVGAFDLGYHIGGGMNYSLGGTTFLVMGLQFNNGLVDVTTHDIADRTILNRLVFQFGIIF
jgi:hypothetical protein